jgi:hypothetical protein
MRARKIRINAGPSRRAFISGLFGRAPFRLEVLFQNRQHMLITPMTGIIP